MVTARAAAHRFWPAVSLSVVLHLALAAVCCYLSAGQSGRLAASPLELDAVAVDEGETSCDLQLALVSPPKRPEPPAAPAPTAQVPSVAPAPTPPPVSQPAPFVPNFVREPAARPVAAGSQVAPQPAAGPSAGTGSGAGRPATAFFQTAARGRKIVYVLDRSSSMGANGALDAVKRELLASLDQLPADAEFQVVCYNRSAEPLHVPGQAGLLPATAANKEHAARRLATLSAEGSTEHLEALRLALTFQPDVIFFLTDADDLKVDHVVTVTRWNRGGATIHTIELNTANRDRADLPLHLLAAHNRGLYRAVALGRP